MSPWGNAEAKITAQAAGPARAKGKAARREDEACQCGSDEEAGRGWQPEEEATLTIRCFVFLREDKQLKFFFLNPLVRETLTAHEEIEKGSVPGRWGGRGGCVQI